MSVVRFGTDGSQVYLYYSDAGLECCGCALISLKAPRIVFKEEGDDAAIFAHLKAHVAAGHCVPAWVLACWDPDASRVCPRCQMDFKRWPPEARHSVDECPERGSAR